MQAVIVSIDLLYAMHVPNKKTMGNRGIYGLNGLTSPETLQFVTFP